MDPAARLLYWFIVFFEYAEDAYRTGVSAVDPVFNVVPCWSYWWARDLPATDKADINDMASSVARLPTESRQAFTRRLRAYLKGKLGDSATACVVRQIPRLPVFNNFSSDTWGDADLLKCVKAVAVQEREGGSRQGIITPLCAFVRPRESNQPFVLCSPDIVLVHEDVTRVRDAVGGLLLGASGCGLLLLGLLTSWPTNRWWLRLLYCLGWLAVAIGLTNLLLNASRVDINTTAAALKLAVLLALGLGVLPLFRAVQEFRCGRELAQHFEKNQVCILSGGDAPGLAVAPRGSSYGLALGVAILSAVLEDIQPQARSLVWQAFLDRFRKDRSCWAFIGRLHRTAMFSGFIGTVTATDVPPKLNICQTDRIVTKVAMPVQNCELPRRMAKSSPGATLTLFRCRHFASVILRVASISNPVATVTSLLALICCATLLLGIPDLCRIFHSLTVPKPVLWKCEVVPYSLGRTSFLFVAETDAPEEFRVRLKSPTQRTRWFPFEREALSPSQAKAEIGVPGVALSEHPEGGPWTIEVVRPESFLGRSLKDTRVLQEDFNTFRKTAELERNHPPK